MYTCGDNVPQEGMIWNRVLALGDFMATLMLAVVIGIVFMICLIVHWISMAVKAVIFLWNLENYKKVEVD